jgi:hypothetical protein
MKKILLLSLMSLAGCGGSSNLLGAAVIGVSAGSIATIQRTPADAAYSWWTGRDCSVVRLDAGHSYCRPVEPPPEPPAYCTRSLGTVNCWAEPEGLPGRPHGVADGPSVLTAEQEADRVRTWPW